MYRQCSCLYRYSAYIFNIGTYSDPYTSIGATLIINYKIKIWKKHYNYCHHGCGNSERTAGHFGLFSTLLSCSPFTLYTA